MKPTSPIVLSRLKGKKFVHFMHYADGSKIRIPEFVANLYWEIRIKEINDKKKTGAEAPAPYLHGKSKLT